MRCIDDYNGTDPASVMRMQVWALAANIDCLYGGAAPLSFEGQVLRDLRKILTRYDSARSAK